MRAFAAGLIRYGTQSKIPFIVNNTAIGKNRNVGRCKILIAPQSGQWTDGEIGFGTKKFTGSSPLDSEANTSIIKIVDQQSITLTGSISINLTYLSSPGSQLKSSVMSCEVRLSPVGPSQEVALHLNTRLF